MHELAVMSEVVRIVEEHAKKEKLKKVDTLILQIGELSSVVPYFVEQCYPAAAYGTMLENTKLEIEIMPGNGRCKKCGAIYNVIENRRICPNCKADSFEILGGREFIIKQISGF